MGRRVPFVNNEYYHVYNRGVEKRSIFVDEHDRERFLFMLSYFNSNSSSKNNMRDFAQGLTLPRESDPLVEIRGWCLMSNHYHLHVRQLEDNGVSKLLQRVMTGYTMYFNLRHKRTGALFQGRSKSRHINKENYLHFLDYYIGTNCLDLKFPNWRKKGLLKPNDAREYITNYPWVDSHSKSIAVKNIGMYKKAYREGFIFADPNEQGRTLLKKV